MPFVSQKHLNELVDSAKQLLTELEQIKKRPFLMNVERAGRVNTFTFCRNGEFYKIETMGLMSDNLPEWKEKLLR
jgi:hypothetical protein